MLYDKLLREAEKQSIEVYEKPLQPAIKGLYADNTIWINKNLPTTVEKSCILAEELGHYHTTSGNILDQSSIQNRKQEQTARIWAYRKLVPLQSFVKAHKLAIQNIHELADFLNVTEDFLREAIDYYIKKYGNYVKIDDYHICFEPLGVLEMFEN